MEEEITLRELIEILWKGKWLIILITSIAIFASGIVSFFVLDPQYEAKSTLMVQQTNQRPTPQGNSLEDILSSLSQYPSLTIDTYKTQITSNTIMRRVVNELDLENKYGINARQLKSMVSINVPNNTNLMEIKVQHADPQLAADIVNAVARQFTEFVNEQSNKQIQKSVVYIEQQLQEEERHYKEVEKEWKVFLQQPNGVDELQKEIDAKLNQLTSFKTRLLENQVEIESNKAAYEKAVQQLAQTDETVVTNSSLANSPLFNEAAKSGEDLKVLSELQLAEEQLNPVYTLLQKQKESLAIDLQRLRANQNSIEKQISSLQKNLEELQVQLVEKQLEHDRLSQKFNSARESYKAFLDKLNEVRLATSVNVGEKNVMVVNEAIAPEEPVGPNKVLNVLIAAVVGGMLSVFLVFVREYWKNSGINSREQHIEL